MYLNYISTLAKALAIRTCGTTFLSGWSRMRLNVHWNCNSYCWFARFDYVELSYHTLSLVCMASTNFSWPVSKHWKKKVVFLPEMPLMSPQSVALTPKRKHAFVVIWFADSIVVSVCLPADHLGYSTCMAFPERALNFFHHICSHKSGEVSSPAPLCILDNSHTFKMTDLFIVWLHSDYFFKRNLRCNSWRKVVPSFE